VSEPNYSELMDDADRVWLSSFGAVIDNAAMVEGYLAVIVVIDQEGARRWQPIIRITAPVDSVVGMWTMAGHQITASALTAGHPDESS
jgi:hypothetical protein